MTNHENLKIIAFVGLAGSGKSTAVDYLTEKGFPKVYFGGVILSEMEKAGIEISTENERAFREEVRQKHGNDFVVKRIIDEIHDLDSAGQHRIIADGLYSWTEYKALKHEFPGEITVVAILTPQHLRHHRLETRPERPLTPQDATDRDWREIENLEKGGPIAIADHYVSNDGDVDRFYQQLDELLESIDFRPV